MSDSQLFNDPDLTIREVLGCYELDPKQMAILELAANSDSIEAVESLEPALQEACRALIREANAEAEFNDRFKTR